MSNQIDKTQILSKYNGKEDELKKRNSPYLVMAGTMAPVICDCYGNVFESCEALCEFYNTTMAALSDKLSSGVFLDEALGLSTLVSEQPILKENEFIKRELDIVSQALDTAEIQMTNHKYTSAHIYITASVLLTDQLVQISGDKLKGTLDAIKKRQNKLSLKVTALENEWKEDKNTLDQIYVDEQKCLFLYQICDKALNGAEVLLSNPKCDVPSGLFKFFSVIVDTLSDNHYDEQANALKEKVPKLLNLIRKKLEEKKPQEKQAISSNNKANVIVTSFDSKGYYDKQLSMCFKTLDQSSSLLALLERAVENGETEGVEKPLQQTETTLLHTEEIMTVMGTLSDITKEIKDKCNTVQSAVGKLLKRIASIREDLEKASNVAEEVTVDTENEYVLEENFDPEEVIAALQEPDIEDTEEPEASKEEVPEASYEEVINAAIDVVRKKIHYARNAKRNRYVKKSYEYYACAAQTLADILATVPPGRKKHISTPAEKRLMTSLKDTREFLGKGNCQALSTIKGHSLMSQDTQELTLFNMQVEEDKAESNIPENEESESVSKGENSFTKAVEEEIFSPENESIPDAAPIIAAADVEIIPPEETNSLPKKDVAEPEAPREEKGYAVEGDNGVKAYYNQKYGLSVEIYDDDEILPNEDESDAADLPKIILPDIKGTDRDEIPDPTDPSVSDKEKFEEYLDYMVELFSQFKSPENVPITIRDMFDVNSPRHQTGKLLLDAYIGKYSHLVPEKNRSTQNIVAFCARYMKEHPRYEFAPDKYIKLGDTKYCLPTDNTVPSANKFEKYIRIPYPFKGSVKYHVKDMFDARSPRHAGAKEIGAHYLDLGEQTDLTEISNEDFGFLQILQWCLKYIKDFPQKAERQMEMYKPNDIIDVPDIELTAETREKVRDIILRKINIKEDWFQNRKNPMITVEGIKGEICVDHLGNPYLSVKEMCDAYKKRERRVNESLKSGFTLADILSS